MDSHSTWINHRGSGQVCWDSAGELFFATLKNQMCHRQMSAIKVRAQFAAAEFIEVFYRRKRKRMHSTIDYCTPALQLTNTRRPLKRTTNRRNQPKTVQTP
ncbi:unannotated protein [freshwater metagenome]|uniref:Unannotated protein n=1 Tax=freshwater metagenome TaxID=449393 RepID=A0A6J7MD77_9ZZZZ